MPAPPNDVVVISVPHTGTLFTVKLFKDAGFDEKSLFDPRWVVTPSVFHGHMIKEGQIARAIELAETMPLVIPFRHPFRVAYSWQARGKPLDEMFQCYRTLITRFIPLKPYWMPVDSDRRGEVLEKLSASLGVELVTDGAVVNGVRGTHTMKMSEFTPTKKVIELAQELEPVMAELY